MQLEESWLPSNLDYQLHVPEAPPVALRLVVLARIIDDFEMVPFKFA